MCLECKRLTSHLSLLYVGASIGAWSVNNKIPWTCHIAQSANDKVQ